MKLSQVRLLTDDFPASFRSYRDVLGLEPMIEIHEELAPEEG